MNIRFGIHAALFLLFSGIVQPSDQPSQSVFEQAAQYFNRIFGISGTVRDALRFYSASDTPAFNAQQKDAFASLPLQEKLYVLNEWAARQSISGTSEDAAITQALQEEIQPLLPKKISIIYDHNTNQFAIAGNK